MYSIDTNIIIGAWVRQYPPDVFPSMWDKFNDLILAKEMLISEEVLYETERQEDDVYKWVKARNEYLVPSDEKIQKHVEQILTTHEKLIDSRSSQSAADPFIIAVAMENDCTVVTEETPTNNTKRPKIPDVCAFYGLKCIGILDLIREKRWSFR